MTIKRKAKKDKSPSKLIASGAQLYPSILVSEAEEREPPNAPVRKTASALSIETNFKIEAIRRFRSLSAGVSATICITLILCVLFAEGRYGKFSVSSILAIPPGEHLRLLQVAIAFLVVLLGLTTSVVIGTIVLEERARRYAQ